MTPERTARASRLLDGILATDEIAQNPIHIGSKT
jgi:hypothetical protein